jgi:photosystem II stability/assembly factor-like uncharacterized protein
VEQFNAKKRCCMSITNTIPLIACLGILGACSQPAQTEYAISWAEQQSGTDLSLRGLSLVDASTIWVGAPEGHVLRSLDGGQNWRHTIIPGAELLDLRSVHAFDRERALLFTAGTPAQLYSTDDGGQNYALVYEDPSNEAFFDSLAFWDDQNGIAFSDPVGGAFHILLTQNGGQNWSAADNLPVPLDGEAGFAASDTSIALASAGRVWIGTGGAQIARVLFSGDWGQSWQVFDTPLASGSSGAGIFSLAAANNRLFAVGGNYTDEDVIDGVMAWSDDDGRTWTTPSIGPSGYRSAIAAIPGLAGYLVAVGPNGADLSRDNGESWHRISETGYHAVAFADDGRSGFATGSDGRIAKILVSAEDE